MDDNYKSPVTALFEIIKLEMKTDKLNYLFLVRNDLFGRFMEEWLPKYTLNSCIDLYCTGFLSISFNASEYL